GRSTPAPTGAAPAASASALSSRSAGVAGCIGPQGRDVGAAPVAAVGDDLEARVERDHRVVRDVPVDHRVGADAHVVADADRAEYARPRRDVDAVADHRHAAALARAAAPDGDALREAAVAPDARFSGHGDAAEVADIEARADLGGARHLDAPEHAHQEVKRVVEERE